MNAVMSMLGRAPWPEQAKATDLVFAPEPRTWNLKCPRWLPKGRPVANSRVGMQPLGAARVDGYPLSTVLAQDHFYSDF